MKLYSPPSLRNTAFISPAYKWVGGYDIAPNSVIAAVAEITLPTRTLNVTAALAEGN